MKLENGELSEGKRNRERLERVKKIFQGLQLLSLGIDGLDGTRDFTLIGDPLGYSSEENSSAASNQFLFSLAMSGDTQVKEVAARENRNKIGEIIEELIKKQVLTGLKILDLGCGSRPTFARVARAAGADVYTVDVQGAEDFEYYDKEKIDARILKEEVEKHIQVDLHDEGALEMIRQKTGAEFDLVSSAHLETGFGGYNFSEGKGLAMRLLKKGGLYFNASHMWLKGDVEVKE